jgi:hypothetical protein
MSATGIVLSQHEILSKFTLNRAPATGKPQATVLGNLCLEMVFVHRILDGVPAKVCLPKA